MVELKCPNCGADVELQEVDSTDDTTTFNNNCPACRADLTLIWRGSEDDD